jgi:hypothetical protein
VSSDKYLVAHGLSDEDEAHLRLLMRRAALDHLAHRWHWGNEDKADLVVVDPTTFAGQMARGRAHGSGRRCAVYSATEPLQEGELRLPRPMKLEVVAELFNEVATATEIEASASFVPAREGFYEFGDLVPSAEEIEEVELHLESGEQREARPAQGLDDLIKTDTDAAKPVSAQLELKRTRRSKRAPGHGAARKARRRLGRRLRKPDRAGGEINLSTPSVSAPPAHSPNSLRDYLRGNLLGGPATITLVGSPPLTLDPKGRVYHSTAPGLNALMPYCKQALPARDWHVLTTTELARVRDEQPAQPYSRLIWLATLVRSGGRLASNLDPGGRYKLKDGVQIEADQPSHARIGNVMRDMAKLNEIAAVSGAPMSEVFDVINAYEAIHALETERRESRYTEPANVGLFARLRKSLFGR